MSTVAYQKTEHNEKDSIRQEEKASWFAAFISAVFWSLIK